jgi:hypothetical protein
MRSVAKSGIRSSGNSPSPSISQGMILTSSLPFTDEVEPIIEIRAGLSIA